MAFFECVDNHHPYPKDKFEYKCPECGSAYDLVGGINYRPELVDSNQPGLWKYKHTFGLPEIAPTIYLGEGNTPLVETRIENKQVYFKLESLNPTGSFKDRINAVNMSFLVSRGIQAAVEDSSGNAGASFSAYASRAGLDGKVFVPSYASGPKRKQIEAYGAELVLVPGPRLEATKAVLQAVEEEGSAYASHVYLPHGILGLATTGYEIYD